MMVSRCRGAYLRGRDEHAQKNVFFGREATVVVELATTHARKTVLNR
jgi:hypothetical protein